MTYSVQDEISDMLKAMSEPDGLAQEPESVKKEPAAEEHETEVKAEEPSREDTVEPEVGAEPKTEPSPEVAKTTSVPPSEDFQKLVADLKAEIEVLKTRQGSPPEPPKEEPKLEEKDFLSGVDLDDLTRDPEEFNKVLNKIYHQASVDAHNRIMASLPDVVRSNLLVLDELKSATDQFYSENDDLRPFQKVVGVVFEELASKDPSRSYKEIIKEVAPEVRKRLGLPEQTKANESKSVKPSTPPKLPQKSGKPGRVPETQTVDPLLAELEEMAKVIRS